MQTRWIINIFESIRYSSWLFPRTLVITVYSPWLSLVCSISTKIGAAYLETKSKPMWSPLVNYETDQEVLTMKKIEYVKLKIEQETLHEGILN